MGCYRYIVIIKLGNNFTVFFYPLLSQCKLPIQNLFCLPSIVTSGYLRYWFLIWPFSFDISKAYLPKEVLLSGYFIFFGLFFISPRNDLSAENPSKSTVSDILRHSLISHSKSLGLLINILLQWCMLELNILVVRISNNVVRVCSR